MKKLTAKRARELFQLNSETGELFWSSNSGKRGTAPHGSLAGWVNEYGYWIIKADEKQYRRGRVVWLIVTGEWPIEEIDHINGMKCDDRPFNLREATRQQNNWNTKIYKTNKTGVRGVMATRSGKFVAQIRLNKQAKRLGLFLSLAEAKAAYDAVAQQLRGEFVRT